MVFIWSWNGFKMSEKSTYLLRTWRSCRRHLINSKVDLKDSINSVGKSDIKPTVSERITWWSDKPLKILLVGSKVEKSIFLGEKKIVDSSCITISGNLVNKNKIFNWEIRKNI